NRWAEIVRESTKPHEKQIQRLAFLIHTLRQGAFPATVGLYSRLASWVLTIIEAVMVLTVAAMTLRSGRSRNATFFARAEQSFAKIARRRGLSILLVAMLCIALRASIIPIIGITHLDWYDELRFILVAEAIATDRHYTL